jgi:flagellar hook-associated protein 2
MEPVATFQGLATGINFRDMVDQIIQAESRPVDLMQARQVELGRETTAWGDFKNRVQTIQDRAKDLSDGVLFDSYKTAITGVASGETAPLSASASSSATEGSYSVKVLQLATREKVGSSVFQDRTTALGLAGEFLVGGKAVQITATQSLDDVLAAINSANTGSTASDVGASIVGAPSGGYRLVLTADDYGATGVNLADGSAGVLKSLGFLDSTTNVKNTTSDGAKSDGFLSSGTAVGTLLNLSSPPASAAVTIGSLSVTIDLSADSLSDISSAINTAASGAGSSISAQIVSETDADGNTLQRLDISGTTSFTDANGILETIGVVQGGRGAIAQQVQGAAFTDGDAVTTATGASLLTNIWGGGAAAGVQVNDTLTLSGTRGDGTTFTKTFTVGVSSTYQDLVDSLNSSSDAFGVGSSTATASISSGRLVVTDDTGGDSRLSLSIITNNEGGGTLDFGDFSTATEGHDREITAGVDAQIDVDGAFYSRSSNNISDVVTGVTITASEVSAQAVSVGITRDIDLIVGKVESLVKSYNAVAEFVDSQFSGAGAQDGQLARPLSGDGTIRQMKAQLRAAFETALSSSVTDIAALRDLGIEINREGTYDIDSDKLRTAVETDAVAVQRFFSAYGTGSTSSIEYVASTDATTSGSYAIDITTAAAQATKTGVGFAGTYVDDGTADTLTLTDVGNASSYSVSLSNGMTMTQIVDAINAELQIATKRQLDAANAMKSDAIGTDATESTLLQDLYDSGGTNLGIADGDVITISGARDDGSTFFKGWTVSDVTTQTLGDLRAQISTTIGTDVILDLNNGVIRATAAVEGRSTFTLTVSSDNAGGGTLDFGAFGATVEGRGKASITATDSGGQLKLAHDDYGSAAGFTVAYTAGGTDGSASLGIVAGSYTGIDIVGTIGGQAATGAGRTLTADAGTSAEGALLRYTGTATGAVGSLTFSRGIASAAELVADALLDVDGGSIQGIVDGIDTQKKSLDDRIKLFEDRLDLRRANLIKRFSDLESAMAKAQNQLAWMQSTLGALVAPTG